MLLHAALTDVGRVREVNEDAFGSDEVGHGQLFVVADGMGGHQSGDVASRLAVKSIIEGFRDSTAIDPSRRLLDALRSAHERIMARQGQRTGRDRMGTTAVALYISPELAHYAWVGDSRIYLVREGQLSSITRDHTVGRELLERGVLGPEELVSHPDGHKLSRALGMERQWQPECGAAPLPLDSGDMFLLCSDGLYKSIPDGDVLSVLLGHEPEQAADRLVVLANERGGTDNITVQVVRVGSREAAVEAAAREGHIGSLTTELQALASVEIAEIEAVTPSRPSTHRLGPGGNAGDVPGDEAPTDGDVEPPTVRIGPGDTAESQPVVPIPPPDDFDAAEDVTDDETAEGETDDELAETDVEPAVSDVEPLSSGGEAAIVAENLPDDRPQTSPPVVRAATLPSGPRSTVRSMQALPYPPEHDSSSGDQDESSEETRVVSAAASVPTPRAIAVVQTPEATPAISEVRPAEGEPAGPVEPPDDEVPRKRGMSKFVIVAGMAIGLLFILLVVSLIGVVASVMIPRGSRSQGFTDSPSSGGTPVVAVRDPDLAGAAASIRAIPEEQQCDQQWSLLREHHSVLAADPYTLRDISGRVYRCYDRQALDAVETFQRDGTDANRKVARTKIGHARRFLEPGSRADNALEAVAAGVAADLGPVELESRVAELDAWEESL